MRNVPECPRRVVCHERAELVVATQPNELAVSVSITNERSRCLSWVIHDLI